MVGGFLIVFYACCRRERALSVDLRHEGRMDFLHYIGDSTIPK